MFWRSCEINGIWCFGFHTVCFVVTCCGGNCRSTGESNCHRLCKTKEYSIDTFKNEYEYLCRLNLLNCTSLLLYFEIKKITIEASLRTKLVELMEFQLSYFKSWKMMLWKCCTKYYSKFGKLSSGHRIGKGQFSFQSQGKAVPKNAQTTAQLHISHASRVMLKILEARFQQYVNCELPDVQAGFRKGRGTRDQIGTMCWIIKKAREFQKNIYFCFIDYVKAFHCVVKTSCGKFWKRWEYQTTWPASWEICTQVRKQSLELDVEQQTGSK